MSSQEEERTVLQFVARDDGTAIDAVTGLTWCRYLVGQEWNKRRALGEAIEITLNDVMKEIDSVNAALLGSFYDWRLPTQDELNVITGKGKVIVGSDNSLRATNAVILYSAPKDRFWTQGTAAQDFSIESTASYYGGKVARAEFTLKYARLVRG